MFKISGRFKIISFLMIAVMLCGIFTFSVSAANPVVIDFSKYDFEDDILTSMGGQGDFSMKADGDRWVLLVECNDGYDPDGDPDGTGAKGDIYATIIGFKDLDVDADTYQWMKLGVRNESNAPHFEFHFESPTKGFHVESSVTLDIDPNSDYKSYVYNVTDMCKKYYPKRPADVENPDVYPDHWHGHITSFRLDFMYYEESGGHARTGDKIYVEYVAFFDSKQAANDFVFTPARTVTKINEEKAEKAAAAEAAKAEETPATEDPAIKIAAVIAAAENKDANKTPAEENDTTTASSSTSNDSDNMLLMIVIAAIAVVVIVVIVIFVTKGKKKE